MPFSNFLKPAASNVVSSCWPVSPTVPTS